MLLPLAPMPAARESPPLHTWLAAAYVRGKLAEHPAATGVPTLFSAPFETLDEESFHALIHLGREQGLRLHRFKRAMGLPRVGKVLGILKGLRPADLLDIGSGRGAFLWPLLDAFPDLPVTALDRLDFRAADIAAVHAGGFRSLTSILGDVTALTFDQDSFDVVTMLEVLEHVPDPARALREVCRVARRFVVLSVPSAPDNNPEHIHLLSSATLQTLLQAAGADRVTFEHVHGHLIAVARVATTGR